MEEKQAEAVEFELGFRGRVETSQVPELIRMIGELGTQMSIDVRIRESGSELEQVEVRDIDHAAEVKRNLQGFWEKLHYSTHEELESLIGVEFPAKDKVYGRELKARSVRIAGLLAKEHDLFRDTSIPTPWRIFKLADNNEPRSAGEQHAFSLEGLRIGLLSGRVLEIPGFGVISFTQLTNVLAEKMSIAQEEKSQ